MLVPSDLELQCKKRAVKVRQSNKNSVILAIPVRTVMSGVILCQLQKHQRVHKTWVEIGGVTVNAENKQHISSGGWLMM